jgi:glycosyltransferase involved in cell wall biosynthesis
MSRHRYDICAAVVSDLAYDARVWKEVRSLAEHGYRVRLLGCCYETPRTRTWRAGSVDVFEVSLGSRSGRVSLPGRSRTLLRLWLEILRTPARAYHAHNIHTGPAAWLASRLRRAALIYDAHELYGEPAEQTRVDRLSASLGRRLERFMVQRSDHVITTNQSRAEILEKRHGRGQIVVLENVPARRETVEALDPGFPRDAPILLYQGGIYARTRGFRQAIEAVSTLDDVCFAILGFGREHDLGLIRSWAADFGIVDRVKLLPPRPFDELVRTAAAATVGIVPILPRNLAMYTGDTNKLFEYLMAGLPVVGSDLPEIRRVLTMGDPPVGEVFDPESPASIADAIRRILEDPETYRLRRHEARRLALERYNWKAQEERLVKIYRSALS